VGTTTRKEALTKTPRAKMTGKERGWGKLNLTCSITPEFEGRKKLEKEKISEKKGGGEERIGTSPFELRRGQESLIHLREKGHIKERGM